MFPVAETVLTTVKGTPQEFWKFEGGRSERSVEYGLRTRWTIVVKGGQLAIHQDGHRSVICVIYLALEEEDDVGFPIYEYGIQGLEVLRPR